MKILPFLLLLSFACYGQIDMLKYGRSSTFIGISATGKPINIVDTPQTDSNPHDFYQHGDTFELKITPPFFNYDSLYGRFVAVPLPYRPFPYPIMFTDDKPREKSLEEKLLLYAQECYNDSSKYCYYMSRLGNGEEVGIPCDCGHYNNAAYDSTNFYYIGYHKCTHMKYIHRKPDFGEFLEWLKNRK